MTISFIRTGLYAALLCGAVAMPAAAQTATAPLKDGQGKEVGSVNLTQTPRGVLINVSVNMPNLHVPQSGDLTVEVVNAAVTLDKGKPNSLFDADGSAIVIHAGSDDYKTDPTGEAGGRIACGVVQ